MEPFRLLVLFLDFPSPGHVTELATLVQVKITPFGISVQLEMLL